jgi:sulfite reductase (ferredoxin)
MTPAAPAGAGAPPSAIENRNLMPTETATQVQERIKREQNPWQELPRLLEALRGGIGALDAADLNTRLRWWGLYTQGDGGGAFGGAAPYFMLRVRVPNGLLTAGQTQILAHAARDFGRGVVDVTVRQNLQLHWLEAERLPALFERLAAAGLTSQAACGDDPRNLTGCPLAGVDPDEYADASPWLLAANRALLEDQNFANLPRKFKGCVSGCRHWCSHPEINDVAFTARADGGYDLRVGGGLSTAPHLALPLPVRLEPQQIPAVACAVAELFRVRDELRAQRHQARLKFLFLRHGWTVERFRAELERVLGFGLAGAAPQPAPAAEFRDHLGLRPQRQPGLLSAGISVLRGRLTAGQLEAVAEAAARWAGGEVRATAMQNLLVPNVRESEAAAFAGFLERNRLPLAASSFRRGVMSCTGKEFCKLAVTETKSFAAELVAELERRLPGFPLPLRVNLNGCPNSCGQHWIADVGLQGTRVRTPAGAEDGFDVYLGGSLGAGARLARKTLGRVRAAELAPRLESLCRHFAAGRLPGESFTDFVERRGTRELEAVLGQWPQAEVLVKLREHEDD